MPDKDMPNPASNMEKAEGDRWTSDPDTVEVADRYKEGAGKTDEKTGGNQHLTKQKNGDTRVSPFFSEQVQQ
jgi:hypothetical protein